MKKKHIVITSSIVLLGFIVLIIFNISNRSPKQAEITTPVPVEKSAEVAVVEEAPTPEPTLEPTPEPVVKEEPEVEEHEAIIETQPEDTGVELLDQTMYAVSAVNVRAGDNADTEKVGSLNYAQAVHVTGQSKGTKWYQITQEDGAIVYVSNNFLSDNKPVNQTVEPLAGASIADTPVAPVVDYSGEFGGPRSGVGGTIGGLGTGGSGEFAGVQLY